LCSFSVLLEIKSPTLDEKERLNSLNAESRYYTTAEYIFYPFEMASVILALMLVLHRVKGFAFGTHQARTEQQQRVKRIVVRSFVGAILSLIVLSICSCFAASAYFHKGASLNAAAASAFALDDAAEGNELRQEARETQSRGDAVIAIARWADVCMLLMTVAAFVAMTVLCSKVFAAALRTLFAAEKKMTEMMETSPGPAAAGSIAQGRKLIVDASNEGRVLKRKIITTFTFAFLSLILRTVLTLIYALASSGQNNSNTCAFSYCATCKNVWSNVHGWLLYTPSFQMIAVLVSSPVAMMVSLWGMSGVGALEDLTVAQTQMMKASKDKSHNASSALQTTDRSSID
jgi:hypothetical protein